LGSGRVPKMSGQVDMGKTFLLQHFGRKRCTFLDGS
jgi:hypothetical protein